MNMTARTILPIVLGFALLVGASTTHAQTSSNAALIAQLQAQLAALIAGKANAGFSADLSVGRSGAEVTRLQNFLMDRGYPIAAGATGYFGEQTRAALARYQTASGIQPAVGYFGVLTRTRVNAALASTLPTTPTPDEDTDDEDEDNDTSGDADEGDADYALERLDTALDRASDDIEEADDDGDDVDEAEDLLAEAQNLRDEANDAFNDEDWDEVIDLTDEAQDLVDDINDELDTTDDEDTDVGDARLTAETVDVSGTDNDYAVFEIELEIEAFNQDVYISQNAGTAFTYRIENASNGTEVMSSTAETATVSSTADETGNFYRIDEDSSESFTFTVTFNPLPSDEGGSYRLQLLTVRFNDTAAAPDDTWNASPSSDYETDATYIND